MMCTYLQQVTAAKIEALVAKPESIARLDEPETFATHYMATINYFLTGSAYPTRKRGPLALALMGTRNVKCRVLENGCFDVVPPERVKAIADALRAVDVEAVEAAVAEADLEALVDEEGRRERGGRGDLHQLKVERRRALDDPRAEVQAAGRCRSYWRRMLAIFFPLASSSISLSR